MAQRSRPKGSAHWIKESIGNALLMCHDDTYTKRWINARLLQIAAEGTGNQQVRALELLMNNTMTGMNDPQFHDPTWPFDFIPFKDTPEFKTQRAAEYLVKQGYTVIPPEDDQPPAAP